jgi:hypothetical protein
MDIPLEMIDMVEQSTSMQGMDYDEAEGVQSVQSEEEVFEPVVPEPLELLFFGNVIRDINAKEIDSKTNIITEEGIIMNPPKKLCHCGKAKVYKNCCGKTDFVGEFGSDKVFYCDLEAFKKRFHCEVVDKKGDDNPKNNNPGELNNVTKHMEKIFI